jgi:hypothetical protein
MSNSDDKIIELEVGSLVEAKDFEQTWLNAQIIQLDNLNNRVKIHFLDFVDSRFDEWVFIDEQNIRQIKSNTEN